MQSGVHGARPGIAEDAPAAARALAAAFADTAFTAQSIPQDHRLARMEQLHLMLIMELALPYGMLFVSDDLLAASLWVAPAAQDADGILDAMEATIEQIAGAAFVAANRRSKVAMAEHAPAEPSWYLASVGVTPSAQGSGLGTAVIRPGLAVADVQGVPVYLETSTPRNLVLYRRLGFEVTAEYPLPDGGPLTWTMVRPVAA